MRRELSPEKQMFISLLIFLLSAISMYAQPLTLADAEKIALSQNTSVRVKGLEEKNATSAKNIARSTFLPSASAFASYRYVSDYTQFELPLPTGTQSVQLGDNDNYSVGLEAGYTLYSGGADTARYKRARKLEKAAKLGNLDARERTLYMVRSAFYQVLFLGESVRLAQESLDRVQEREKEAKEKYSAGAVPQTELLDAQTRRANQEFFLRDAKQQQREGLQNFALLLDFPSDKEIELSGALSQNPDLPENLSVKSVSQSPALQALAAQAEAAKDGQRATMASFYPRITAGARYEYMRPYLQVNQEFDDLFSVNVQATLPLFTGGDRWESYKTAKNQKEMAELQLSEARRSLESRASLLSERYSDLYRGLSNRRENTKRARESYDSYQVAWRSGTATARDLSDAELLVFQAEIEYYGDLAEIYRVAAEYESLTGQDTGIFK